jgi:hypothetical protein
MVARRSRTYRFRAVFHAPLPFVFRWCTDYRTDDARLEHESFERRILQRTSRRVIYEDLERTRNGWSWRRHVVTLRPPDRWWSDSVGNYRDFHLEYELRELPGGRTEMRFRGRRVPAVLASPNPPVREFVRSMENSWRHFGVELERDYRRSRRTRRRAR